MTTASRPPDGPANTDARSAVALWVGGGLVAVVLGALITKAYAPTIFGDPGAFVLWSLPIAKTVFDLAAAGTVGLLLVGAFFVPVPKRSKAPQGAAKPKAFDPDVEARQYTLSWVTGMAMLWVAAGVMLILSTFGDIAGLGLSDPSYPSQLGSYVWSLETTRIQLISTVLAALVATGALATRSRATMVWLLVLAIVAAVIPALTGHAAGSASHETAVNALGIHLLAASLWCGGLFALAVLRTRFGRRLGTTVARYSVGATWCFAAIAVSGVQQAWIRIGGLSGFTTAYGALVIAKVVALGVIGMLAIQQRRNIADRLTRDPADGRAFLQLALGELATMGIASGLAVVLSRSVPPVPDTVPNPSIILKLTGFPDPGPMTAMSWVTQWRISWLFLTVALIAMGLYAAGVRRLRQRGDAWPVGRTVNWMVGWVIWIYATSGAPDIWGRVLFSVHMIMHMAVAMIIPIFLVLGAPITLALRALTPRDDRTWGPRELINQIAHSRVMRWLANPVVASAFFFLSLAVFYWTPLFSIALRTHTGHLLMMGHFVLTGYLFVWVLIGIDPGPPRWSPLMLLVILFATISFHAFFGVILTDTQTLLASDFFTAAHPAWAPDPFADQRKAGEIAWGIGEVPTLALAILVARNWVKSDRRDTIRLDRQADRDGDADLNAYNDYLAGLRKQSESPED